MATINNTRERLTRMHFPAPDLLKERVLITDSGSDLESRIIRIQGIVNFPPEGFRKEHTNQHLALEAFNALYRLALDYAGFGDYTPKREQTHLYTRHNIPPQTDLFIGAQLSGFTIEADDKIMAEYSGRISRDKDRHRILHQEQGYGYLLRS